MTPHCTLLHRHSMAEPENIWGIMLDYQNTCIWIESLNFRRSLPAWSLIVARCPRLSSRGNGFLLKWACFPNQMKYWQAIKRLCYSKDSNEDGTRNYASVPFVGWLVKHLFFLKSGSMFLYILCFQSTLIYCKGHHYLFIYRAITTHVFVPCRHQ